MTDQTGLTGQPADDDHADRVYQAATVAILAAIAAAAVAHIAGNLAGAVSGLAVALRKVRVGLARDAIPALHAVVNRAAVRATKQAHVDLNRLGVTDAADPGVRDQVVNRAVNQLTDKAAAVAANLDPAAQRILTAATTAADTAGRDETARTEAAQRTLDKTADRGGIPLVDASGQRWNTDTYMRYAVSAAVRDVEIGIHHAWLRRNGVHLVYVSTNAGACELCIPWEGKILTIDNSGTPGSTVNVPGDDGNHIPVPVSGSVAAARAAGLGHYACRHGFIPISAQDAQKAATGTPPQRDAVAESRRASAARMVRQWRRRKAVAITPAQRRLAKAKLAFWRAQLDATT